MRTTALLVCAIALGCTDTTAAPPARAAAADESRSEFTQYPTIRRDPAISRDIFDGLPDRSRMAPPLGVDGLQHIHALRVDSLFIGNAILMRAGQGTVYADGRLEMQGVGQNSMELAMWPGPLRTGRGITTQILQYSLAWLEPGQRTGWSIIDDGYGKVVMRDSDAFGTSPVMPIYDAVGGRTNAAGEDDGGLHIAQAFFQDRSDEIWMNDGSRINLRDVIKAVIRDHPGEIGCRRPPSPTCER